MAMQLSTSDVVAIVIGVVQLLASVGLAIWTVRKTVPSTKAQRETDLPRSIRSFIWLWFKSSWLFVAFFCLACYEVWALSSGTEQLSKAFVLKVALFSVYGALNAVAAVSFFIIEFQMGLTLRLAGLVEKLSLNQRQALELQRDILATEELPSLPRQSKKRRSR